MNWYDAVGKFVILDYSSWFIINYVISIEDEILKLKSIINRSNPTTQDKIFHHEINEMNPKFRIMTDLEKIKYL